MSEAEPDRQEALARAREELAAAVSDATAHELDELDRRNAELARHLAIFDRQLGAIEVIIASLTPAQRVAVRQKLQQAE